MSFIPIAYHELLGIVTSDCIKNIIHSELNPLTVFLYEFVYHFHVFALLLYRVLHDIADGFADAAFDMANPIVTAERNRYFFHSNHSTAYMRIPQPNDHVSSEQGIAANKHLIKCLVQDSDNT